MRKSAIVLCLAVALCVALTPAPFLTAYAVLVPQWLPFGFVAVGGVLHRDEFTNERRVDLPSGLAPRAPPA